MVIGTGISSSSYLRLKAGAGACRLQIHGTFNFSGLFHCSTRMTIPGRFSLRSEFLIEFGEHDTLKVEVLSVQQGFCLNVLMAYLMLNLTNDFFAKKLFIHRNTIF